jgi:hypothetical protein
MSGISPSTSEQGVNVVAVPQVPITLCVGWLVFGLIAIVPLTVIGVFVATSQDGTDTPTLVTVPALAGTVHVPMPLRYFVASFGSSGA